jgi:hypothetical protein
VATLADWLADDVCRCPDDCLVAPTGICEHGLASWQLVLDAQAFEDAVHHRHPATHRLPDPPPRRSPPQPPRPPDR